MESSKICNNTVFQIQISCTLVDNLQKTILISQQTFSCLNSTKETLEKGVKYIQSSQ